MKKTLLATAVAIAAFFPLTLGAAPLAGRVSLGYTSTSGNTDEQKSNFNFDLSQQRNEKLRFGYSGSATHGRANGETNADKQSVSMVSEFIRNERDSAYVNSGYLKDRFAGYDQRLNMGIGLFRYFVKDDKASLKGSLGIDLTREDYTDDTSSTEKWLKFGLNGNRTMNENLRFISSIELGTPRSDYQDRYQLDSMIGGLCAVNSEIDLEIKYVINYRKTPLVAGKEKQDSNFLTSLVYKM